VCRFLNENVYFQVFSNPNEKTEASFEQDQCAKRDEHMNPATQRPADHIISSMAEYFKVPGRHELFRAPSLAARLFLCGDMGSE